MQAIYLKNNQLTVQKTYPQPAPQTGEALIRVSLIGVCSTDLELVKGYYPYDGVLGHEFVGVVTQCEDADWVGQRVVGTINLSPDCDGSCGLRCPEHCPHRTVLGIVAKDGAMADYVTLPTQNLLRVPDSVPDEMAVFTEPLAAAVRVTEQTDVGGKRVAVVGPGRLGLLVAQVLRHFGADVTVIGRSNKSLKLPKELGFITAHNEDQLAAFELIVETTANPSGFAWAVSNVRPNGTIILKSTYADTTPPNFAALMAQIVVNEITLIGSRCGPFQPALDLLEAGAINVDILIEREYELGDGIAAFDYAGQSGVRKILLRP